MLEHKGIETKCGRAAAGAAPAAAVGARLPPRHRAGAEARRPPHRGLAGDRAERSRRGARAAAVPGRPGAAPRGRGGGALGRGRAAEGPAADRRAGRSRTTTALARAIAREVGAAAAGRRRGAQLAGRARDGGARRTPTRSTRARCSRDAARHARPRRRAASPTASIGGRAAERGRLPDRSLDPHRSPASTDLRRLLAGRPCDGARRRRWSPEDPPDTPPLLPRDDDGPRSGALRRTIVGGYATSRSF